jgi:hypothetical protein
VRIGGLVERDDPEHRVVHRASAECGRKATSAIRFPIASIVMRPEGPQRTSGMVTSQFTSTVHHSDRTKMPRHARLDMVSRKVSRKE